MPGIERPSLFLIFLFFTLKHSELQLPRNKKMHSFGLIF
jgi:hypothetical protein